MAVCSRRVLNQSTYSAVAKLDVGEAAPWPAGLDELGLIETDGGFHQGIAVGVADGADRGADPGLDQVSGEREAGVLRPGVGVVDQARPGRVPVATAPSAGRPARAWPVVRGSRPAGDGPGVQVHDERDGVGGCSGQTIASGGVIGLSANIAHRRTFRLGGMSAV